MRVRTRQARRATWGAVLAAVLVTVAGRADAQVLGTYRWQLQPYCNVVTVTLTQTGSFYTLDGADDQCGAGTLASAAGTAFLNPDGTIGLGLNIVTSPGGAPAHVDATVTLPSGSGTWRDGAGNGGNFVLTNGAGTGGIPRPAGGIGAAAIDPTEVQQRVSGACPAGQAMQVINQDGSVTCAAGAGGAVTSVIAGRALVGGGSVGAITLGVDFGTSSATAARGDHFHGDASGNVVLSGHPPRAVTGARNVGLGDFTLTALTSGAGNVAVGHNAGLGATAGDNNVAVGSGALLQVGDANGNVAVGAAAMAAALGVDDNVAVGTSALRMLRSGGRSAAFGVGALGAVSDGDGNVALGRQALDTLGTGHFNIAVGDSAGTGLRTGSNNLYAATASPVMTESNTIRVGNAQHTRAFMAGINGQTSASGTAVFVNAAGQLGTVNSSRRFKEDIAAVDDGMLARLRTLQPVRFLYRDGYDDGLRTPQYGLIAEDVAEQFPELAVRDGDGRIQTVRYHFLPPLLLAETQRLERERAALAARVAELERLVASLAAAAAAQR